MYEVWHKFGEQSQQLSSQKLYNYGPLVSKTISLTSETYNLIFNLLQWMNETKFCFKENSPWNTKINRGRIFIKYCLFFLPSFIIVDIFILFRQLSDVWCNQSIKLSWLTSPIPLDLLDLGFSRNVEYSH